MAGLKEFKTRIESDKNFVAEFKGVKDMEQLIALAKTKGYDLEQLDENELDAVSGGISLKWLSTYLDLPLSSVF